MIFLAYLPPNAGMPLLPPPHALGPPLLPPAMSNSSLAPSINSPVTGIQSMEGRRTPTSPALSLSRVQPSRSPVSTPISTPGLFKRQSSHMTPPPSSSSSINISSPLNKMYGPQTPTSHRKFGI